MIGGQLSFFSADARPAQPEDVEGLLCGPGQIVRQGQLARVSVVVDADRAEPLAAAVRAAGVAVDVAPAPGGQLCVRSAFEAALLPLAQEWSGAGGKRAPAELVLDGPRLLFWALAAGSEQASSYSLGLGAQDEAVWPAVGAALATAGLAAVFVGPRADGPAYRVTGVRRMTRLRELLGERPEGVRPDRWP